MDDRLDAILAETLADLDLSRGERRQIREHLEVIPLDPRVRRAIRHRAFALARERIQQGAPALAIVEWLEEVTNLVAHVSDEHAQRREEALVRAAFSPGEAPRALILERLAAARSSVDVCVFTITDDVLSDGLLACHGRGVTVRVVSDDGKAEDLGSDVEAFRRAGIEVRIDVSEHHMHHKFAVFDRRSLLTGSYNWTRSAAAHNEENLVLVEDPRLVSAFRSEFDRLWDRFRPI